MFAMNKLLMILCALFSVGCWHGSQDLHSASKLPSWIANDPKVQHMKRPLNVTFVTYMGNSPKPYDPALTLPARAYVTSSSRIGGRRVFNGVNATQLPEGTRWNDDALTVFVFNGVITRFRTELKDNPQKDELMIDKIPALYLVAEQPESGRSVP
jgi:hypothetical protein